MKNIIIVGASGMVGKIILREALASTEVEKVTSLVRRPSGETHSKLQEITHENFNDYSKINDHFKGKDAAYFCIGVYTGAVPDDQFKMITVDFAKAFGDAVKQNSPQARLSFLSGQGADLKEKSRMSFARYKGMAENYLMSLDLGGLHIFRPAYIYPVEKRKEPNLAYRIYRKLYPVLKNIIPSSAITSEQLAKAMFKAGLHGTDKTILENEDIKKV